MFVLTDSLDELLNEAEEAPQEEPERRSWEERRSRDHDIDRRWGKSTLLRSGL